MEEALPIAVFDSGVGGLTVVRALRARLPGVPLLYLGDTARVPYGTRSAETVRRYALEAARFLLERPAQMVVAACNTVSAVALDALAEALPVPVVGVVEPGAAAAARATRSGRIGIC
ncbi:MAG: glutamate racemase, partial [Nitrospirae bacterium]